MMVRLGWPVCVALSREGGKEEGGEGGTVGARVKEGKKEQDVKKKRRFFC